MGEQRNGDAAAGAKSLDDAAVITKPAPIIANPGADSVALNIAVELAANAVVDPSILRDILRIFALTTGIAPSNLQDWVVYLVRTGDDRGSRRRLVKSGKLYQVVI